MAVVSVHLCWHRYDIYYQLSVSVEMGTVGWKWEMGLSICAMGSVDSIASTEARLPQTIDNDVVFHEQIPLRWGWDTLAMVWYGG